MSQFANSANGGNASSSGQPMSSISENVEMVRNRLARAADGGSSTNGGTDELNGLTHPENLYAELQNLRKKYDAVVEYTVHLTAERDTIVQRLEETDKV